MDIFQETRMHELIEVINKHSHNYYVLDNPTVSDAEWDKLYDELKALEKATGVVLENSPSLKVGGEKVLKGFKKHNHLKKFYSLNKATTEEEVLKFINDVYIVDKNATFSFTPKYDGLTISLTYDNGKLKLAATRGNGEVGENITEQIKTIKDIPMEIKFKGLVEINGECLMSLSALKQYNENNSIQLKNARNAAAGGVRNLDVRETAKRNLQTIIYGINYINGREFKTDDEVYAFLKENGFSTFVFKILKTSDEILNEIKNFEDKKNSLDILTDGIVLKVNELKTREQMGYTEKFPKGQLAFKFKAEEVSTMLEDIIWQVGRTGKLTPVAVLSAVELAGATITRATLNNYDDILRKQVKINSRVFIRRSNEVIPEVLGLAEEYKDSVEIKKPENCPVCKGDIVQNGVHIFCKNKSCPAQTQGGILHFLTELEVDGLNEKTIDLFMEKFNVQTPNDLFKLTKENILTLEGFKDKKTINILNAINKLKTEGVPLFRFISSLGISGIGSKNAKLLVENFKTFENIKNAKQEELNSIFGFGEILAETVANYFKDEDNLAYVSELLLNIKILENVAERKYNANFSNKTVVITGGFEKFGRKELTELIESFGAKASSSVSKSTDIVVCGKDAGSKLEKAKELGIRIILEEELYDMF